MTTSTALSRDDRQFSCDSKGVVTSGRVTTTRAVVEEHRVGNVVYRTYTIHTFTLEG